MDLRTTIQTSNHTANKQSRGVPLFVVWPEPNVFMARAHQFSPLSHLSTLVDWPLLTSYTINMVKGPQSTRTNTRYDPYDSSRRPHRRRGTPPPDNWGNRAQTHQSALDSRIYDFLEDIHACDKGGALRRLFRKHARQSGPLGQAIKTWLQYDDVS